MNGETVPQLQDELVRAKVTVRRGAAEAKFEDKITALRAENFPKRAISDRHCARKGSGGPTLSRSTRPWPGRKASTSDVFVTSLLSVPPYLLRREQDDSLQGKALNFGVLEWDLLDRWSTQQKRAVERNFRTEPSAASVVRHDSQRQLPVQADDSGMRTLCTPKEAIVSAANAKLANHPSAAIASDVSSLRTSDVRKQMVESRSSSTGLSTICDQFNGRDGLRRSGSLTSSAVMQSCKVLWSPSLPISESSNVDTRKALPHIGNERISFCANRSSERIITAALPVNNGCLDKYDQQANAASNPSKDHQMEMESTSRLPDLADRRSNVRHSTVLPLVSPADDSETVKTSQTKVSLSRAATEEETPEQSHSISAKKELTCDRSAARPNLSSSVKWGGYCTRQPELIACINQTVVEKKMLERGGRSCSPMRNGRRSEQTEPVKCVYQDDKEKGTPNSKDRRSPLRRMLDPLLKPINRMYSSSPTEHACAKRGIELRSDEKPQAARSRGSALLHARRISLDKEATGPSLVGEEVSNHCETHHRSEKLSEPEQAMPPRRQGLLRIAWKNGVPLFMLSSGESDVLAATFSRKSVSGKADQENLYSIFTVQEPKKKGSSIWMKPASRSKQQHLVSNTIGELSVFCLRTICGKSGSVHVVRRFVLLGHGPEVQSEEEAETQFKNELAAIVCAANEPGYTSYLAISSASEPCNCPQMKMMQKSKDSSHSPSIVAILPRGIHGLSEAGKPTPLIERWQLGGACDCGGWDEGCTLTVLTDSQLRGSSNSCQTTDGTRRIELFSQSRSQVEGQAFSMVSFKEGLYTVEFAAPITLLQAFATCISMLHGKIRNKTATIEAQRLPEKKRELTACKVSKPPSPVSRA